MQTQPAGPARWQIRLLGGLSASDDHQQITRFGSRSVAALLARLALFPQRTHAREELIELLWPGIELDVGRNRLRQALFALRQLLEPPAPVVAPVLQADRAGVRLLEGALACDAVDFERAVRERRYADALALYRGELMPGHYEEWVDEERLRLAALFDRATALAAGAPASAAAPPPLPSMTGLPADTRLARVALPVYLTRFFGRETEGAHLRTEVLAQRLVTLLGAGGSGKTRLAVELAASLRDAGPGDQRFDLVAFVPLVGCSSRTQALDALRAALNLPGGETIEQASQALAGRRCLLVLDNFEQLVDHATDVVARLVATLPGLHLLVTSRRALGLDGEREVAIEPLPLPSAGLPLDEVAINPAVALFVDRAGAARTGFHIGERNRGTLIELVQVLEGMPLALELAASRIRSLAPAEMLALLRPAAPGSAGRPHLDLLARSGVRGGFDARHASMLRTIEWSWQQLGEAQARLMAELTVFRGGFTVAAAQAVCTPGEVAMAVLLDELVSHSLLTAAAADERPAGTRFGMYEAIREYAAGQLDTTSARTLRRRHRHWLADWGAAFPPTPPLAALRSELGNVDAAVASALDDDAPGEAVALLVALRRGLLDTAVSSATLANLAQALARLGADAPASRGHTLLGQLHMAAGHGEAARAAVERGLAIARGVPATDDAAHAELLARALHAAASIGWRTLRQADPALALLDEAWPLAQQAPDRGVQASILALRAYIANIAQRDLAGAEALHGQALALWEQLGDEVSANTGRYNLAVCSLRARRHAQALERLAAVAARARALHDWRLLAQAHNVQGEAHWGLRQWRAAAQAYQRSVELAWDRLAQQPLAYALWNLPHALARLRDPERAARLGGLAQQLWVSRIGPLDASDRRDLRLLHRLAAVQIGRSRTEALWQEGERLSLADGVAMALRTTGAAPA